MAKRNTIHTKKYPTSGNGYLDFYRNKFIGKNERLIVKLKFTENLENQRLDNECNLSREPMSKLL